MTRKTRPLTVLLTDEQYTQAASLAEKRGVGLSTLARALLVQEVARDEQTQTRAEVAGEILDSVFGKPNP